MNNEYVTGLHKYLQGQYGSEFKLNEQQFQDKLNNDPNYINGLHGYLQQQYGSEFKLTPEEFAGKVKKKDQFRFDLESGSRPIQPTSGSKTSQFKPQEFGEFAPLETKKEEDKIEFPGALPESEQKAIDILSQKPSLKFVEDEDLKAYIRENPKAWTEELIKKNPSLKDQTIDGVLPGLMDEEPTLDNQGLKSIENANTLIDYTKSYDEAFDNMSKESDAFTDADVNANPKKYRDAVTNDYLTYLKMVNGEDGQAYLDVKERLDYYNSLGDKLYNDSAYADDLKRYQDIQKQALAKVSNNSYSKSIAIENNYDWKYFSKKSSNLDVKARNIEKQISELGIEEGKALSTPQKKKYEELMNQYSQVKQEFDKLSEETNITPEVIDQIRSQQGRMSSVMNTIDFIDNDKSSNAQSIRQYKAEREANKKAQEEFYNTQDDSNLEATGKGVARLGQQAAKTFVNGIFDIAKMPSIVGEAFGAKGYGWSDKLSETAENINSVVELYNPELDKSNFSGFMSLMNNAGQGLGSVAQFATAGAGASRIAKGLQLSEKGLMTANRAAQFTAAASTSTAGLYNNLIDAGFTPEEAARYSLGGGIVMGAAEMLVPEDELIKNTVKQSFISAVKSGATRKEAIENALGHLAKKSARIVANSGKETFEEGVGSLAESMSKEVASTMTGKKIDGIWDLKNFNTDALAGGQTAFILEMFKFGPRRGRYSNPFEEDLVGYLADNYNEMVETLSSTHPEDYDKIADRYKKLKDIHDGLKNTPSFNNLSKTDQNHVLAQAHAKQVILENIKQSGLSREGFKDEISSIDEDIFQTLNGLRSKDTWVDKSKTQETPVEKTEDQVFIDNLNDDEEYTFSYMGEDKIPPYLKSIAEKSKTKGTTKIGLFGKTENVQFYQVKATGKQIKDLYNAVQEPSTEEVLPREQGTTPETGGQPQGMGQDVQGEEVAQEGQEVSQEGVTKLNQETFAEDVTPEQKAKVEEQNQKDEDEAITEIYDFNDEIKSIGTKDQFAQFLRSLSPTAAFSRIAWHNTSKPQLEPREGQYYTNTRKNAEDTYKQENTFPAIVFGNAPKKASFDEVQDVDTDAVKGEGADVVVTDDLSPSIGADMNYREFVPTSADQVIPIGTKENIEAFKAFVEQQKAAPESKESAGSDSLKDVESTAKALDKKINVKKSSIAVRLRKLAGIIAHSGENVISKFDFSKIKGGLRGRYGKGIYFSSLFKNYDYGDKSTYLDTSKLNLMNGNMTVYEALNTLSLPSKIKRDIDVLKNSLDKVKNNKDYDEISSEIKKLESIYSKFDKNSNYIERTLQKEADKNPSERLDSILENLEARVNESNNLDTSKAIKGLEDSLNNMLIESGFDGINFDEGREILIIPQEKINDYIVQSQEKFISEAYHKAKADGSNPELVSAVEELLGAKESKPATEEKVQPEAQEEVQAATEEVAEKPIEEKEPIVEEAVTEEEAVTSEEQVSLEEKMAKKAVDELMAAKRKRGSKKIEELKNVKEKYGEMGKKLDYIDRNFDKLIDKLGITKSCWLE
jgi:hypothetical protein